MTERAATAASYIASGGAIVAGWTMNEIAALIGSVCAIATVVINAFFQWRRDRRESRRQE